MKYKLEVTAETADQLVMDILMESLEWMSSDHSDKDEELTKALGVVCKHFLPNNEHHKVDKLVEEALK